MSRTFIALLGIVVAACADDDASAARVDAEAGVDAEAEAGTSTDAHVSGDAPSDADDGGADAELDAALLDGGSRRVATVEGELTCGEARSRMQALLDESRSASNTCSSDEDCVCARADTECDSRCEVPINGNHADDFAKSLNEISAFFGRPSSCPCGHTDVDCSTCFAACVMGRCTAAASSATDDAGTE
jgi:hypothetical protein